jgi:catechol 2,3-dioxygenase-like lactoylglutathione lyase family enzyme
MRFDHMCIMVSDMDRALTLWSDVLGFKVAVHATVPADDENSAIPVSAELLDDIFKVKGARSDVVLLVSAEGAMMELQQVQNPPLRQTPREILSGYDYTGVQELGLQVTDIDSWFDRVRAAGYQTQTEYVWSIGELGRTFLFFDDDGNLIQLREGPIPSL